MPESNVVAAWWPRLFRVTSFRLEKSGGYKDTGSYPLETPKVGKNDTWDWLLDQLEELDMITPSERARSGVSMMGGRTIALSDPNGKKFLLLMPS